VATTGERIMTGITMHGSFAMLCRDRRRLASQGKSCHPIPHASSSTPFIWHLVLVS